MVEKATRLKLTQKEESLFKKLLQVCEEEGLKTTLRVAGGWTRDKVNHSRVITCSVLDGKATTLTSLWMILLARISQRLSLRTSTRASQRVRKRCTTVLSDQTLTEASI
jgi:hypothetical protein